MHARTPRCLLVGLLAVVVFAVALAPGAGAATVTVGKDVTEDNYGDRAVYYVAAPGEFNDVFVVAVGDRRIRITDPGAVITATGRCTSIDAHSAVCRGWLMTAHIAAGDLGDRVATPRRFATDAEMIVDGGPGNDVLSGGNEDVVLKGGEGDDQLYGGGGPALAATGNDELYGGDGNDELYGGGESDELDGGGGDDRLYGGDGWDELDGGGGQDQLFGGPGGDWLTDGDRDGAPGDLAPGPDTLAGGTGPSGLFVSPSFDTVSYQQRTEAVRVRAGVDVDAGEAGERDSISGVESIIGGAGDDRLVGDRSDNGLVGRGGADTLIGGGGQDDLWGGRGGDRLLGGRDADELSGGKGIDALACGTDDDLVMTKRWRLREIVPNSCEELRFDWRFSRWQWVRPHPTRTQPWWLRLRTLCPWIWDEALVGCGGTVSVRERGRRHRLLALGRFSHAADGDRFTVPLALTSLGYRWRAGRLAGAPATVALHMIAETMPRRPFKWTIRPPRRE